MRKLIALGVFSLVSFFSISLEAEIEATYITHGTLNGRYWMNMSKGRQLDFLAGFQEACSIYCTEAQNIPLGPTIGDLQTSLTQFYGEPENLAIPISGAIRIFGMKVRSEPQSQIESFITAIRNLALAPDPPPVTAPAAQKVAQ